MEVLMNKKHCIYVLVVFVCITVPVKANYYEYNDLWRITFNSSYDLSSQLSIAVTNEDFVETANQIAFVFYNDAGIDSSITDIYFDDGIGQNRVLDSVIGIYNSDGVNFSLGAHPADPPGYSSFHTTDNFNLDVPKPDQGVDVGNRNEYVAIVFDLVEGKSFSDVIDLLYKGFPINDGTSENSLRIALHISSIGSESLSDTYCVPVPGTIILGILGLGVGGWKLRKTME
jgi:hypothetical protein